MLSSTRLAQLRAMYGVLSGEDSGSCFRKNPDWPDFANIVDRVTRDLRRAPLMPPDGLFPLVEEPATHFLHRYVGPTRVWMRFNMWTPHFAEVRRICKARISQRL